MFRNWKSSTAALGVLAVASFATPAFAETLNGAGGTAIYPVLGKWAADYHKENGTAVNYQAIGSGGGIKQIEAKTVDFANSDKPLKHDEIAKNNLVQFPQVVISIVPVVHVSGINAGDLVLDGKTLADIFLGNVKKWNDPAIARLNPNLKLPDQAITPVYRSDGSGTTFNFTDYLSKVSPDWKSKVGSDTAVQFPGGVGGKGNAGVAQYVQQVDGSIGYVEYAYAKQNKLTYTKMVNHDGKTVTPDMKAFQAAAANADYGKAEDFYVILTDQPGADSWPITAATFMLMRTDASADKNAAVLKFLDWALKNGQKDAEALDYVPLPESVVQQIEQAWTRNLKWQAAAK
ncbi:phosphate ABC transporter substrate-binding protein, PhoT family [Faunimonas pinastri]|uniref:Phosphate-binding protein PstS n=1 Tax=Faunimonas pinastri TaxID=1855383 RepID=A0A1H9KDN7_9HYPH|nr:phosphate ABC transporter substrate-binding protein PstS [Faunimonas pinastri]SEQ97192.1 phosphate ABC transporter substrate-binding protein, PhoT family [Faunimonas pinastri]